MTKPHTLIAGIGSPHGDDQAGWLVAERLADTLGERGVAVQKARSPTELLDWLDGTQRLIVCDACRGLCSTGEVKRWTWPDSELLDAIWSGTHDLPLPAVLQLSERIGRLPGEVVVYAVEAATGGPLNVISKEILESIPKLVDRIIGELNAPARSLTSFSSLRSL